MKLENLRHVVTLGAPPAVVFDALMASRKHAAFTGYSAKISRKVGGTFVTCGGRNFGVNVALVPDERIVQAWTHRNWPKDHYSIATFELSPTRTGTRLIFSHTGVPAAAVRWLDPGWKSTYWAPLKAYVVG